MNHNKAVKVLKSSADTCEQAIQMSKSMGLPDGVRATGEKELAFIHEMIAYHEKKALKKQNGKQSKRLDPKDTEGIKKQLKKVREQASESKSDSEVIELTIKMDLSEYDREHKKRTFEIRSEDLDSVLEWGSTMKDLREVIGQLSTRLHSDGEGMSNECLAHSSVLQPIKCVATEKAKAEVKAG